MRKTLERWRSLPAEERRLLVGLVVLLPVIDLALRLLGFGRTYRLLDGPLRPTGVTLEQSESRRTVAMRLGRLVSLASRRGPYTATCLRQSLALRWLLRRRGMPADVRIGIAKEDDQVRAHAWVELAGEVVDGPSAIDANYAAYPEISRRLARPLRSS